MSEVNAFGVLNELALHTPQDACKYRACSVEAGFLLTSETLSKFPCLFEMQMMVLIALMG